MLAIVKLNNKPAKYKEKTSFSAGLWLFIIYLIVLFYITLFAWNYGASLGPVGPGGRNYNLTPFLSIFRIAVYSPDYTDPVRILVGNIVLFLPFGFLFPLFINRARQNSKQVKIITVVFSALLLSAFIEVNQFLFTYRVANIDDVILNTTGAFLGVITYRILRWIKVI